MLQVQEIPEIICGRALRLTLVVKVSPGATENIVKASRYAKVPEAITMEPEEKQPF